MSLAKSGRPSGTIAVGKDREITILDLRHVQAPESFHDMSMTDLALGIDPRRPSGSNTKRQTWGTQPNTLTSRMDRIVLLEQRRDARRNQEYLLHRIKKNDRFV